MAERLNQRFVDSVTRPGVYGDGGRGSNGLSLRVKPMRSKPGCMAKQWQQRLHTPGGIKTLGLGSAREVKLCDARRAAAANYAGRDNIRTEERRKGSRLAIPTLREASAAVVQSRNLSARDAKRVQTNLAYLGGLAERPVTSITPRDLAETLTDLWQSKRATAGQLLAHLRLAFDWARAADHIEANPADNRVRMLLGPQSRQREHQPALAWPDAPKALATIGGTSATWGVRSALAMLMHSALRSGEVLGAIWTEIDMERGVWAIPAARMKGRAEHRVPLSAEAMAILSDAHERTGGVGYVFPNAQGSQIHGTTLATHFRRLALPSDSPGRSATVHGLRSTFRDWCAEHNVDRETAEVALAHRVGSAVEQAYWRSDLLEQRRAVMQAWSAYLVEPRSVEPVSD